MTGRLILESWRVGGPFPQIVGVRSEILRILQPVARVFWARGLDARITSLYRPGDTGLHGAGRAVDYGMAHVPAAIYYAIFGEIRDALGGAEPYDMQDYASKSHIHIEYDPKGGA